MSENALIKKAQKGDAGAFERLLSMHYDLLFKFAYKWCGSRMDAEDITQQACIKIARSIGQFRFEATFTSWLYRLLINCAKDWQRSQRKHTVKQEDTSTEEQTNPCNQVAENQLMALQILQQLDTMSDGFKETVVLVHGEGRTHSEAASILKVKESTISWRLHEVRKQLRLMFDQEDLYD